MNYTLKQAILESGLKQKHIAEKVGMTPVNFSKKLIGDLYFTDAEKTVLSKLLCEPVGHLFPKELEDEG